MQIGRGVKLARASRRAAYLTGFIFTRPWFPHYRHPSSSFQTSRASTLLRATTCYLSIVTCRRSAHVSTLNTSLLGNSFQRATSNLYHLSAVHHHTFPPSYISSYISFFPLLSSLSSLPLSFHAPPFSRAHPSSPLLCIHLRAYRTYANACKPERALA